MLFPFRILGVYLLFGVPPWPPISDPKCASCEFHSSWYSHLASDSVSLPGLPSAQVIWRGLFSSAQRFLRRDISNFASNVFLWKSRDSHFQNDFQSHRQRLLHTRVRELEEDGVKHLAVESLLVGEQSSVHFLLIFYFVDSYTYTGRLSISKDIVSRNSRVWHGSCSCTFSSSNDLVSWVSLLTWRQWWIYLFLCLYHRSRLYFDNLQQCSGDAQSPVTAWPCHITSHYKIHHICDVWLKHCYSTTTRAFPAILFV